MIKLFQKNVQAQNGTMFISKNDINRMPSDFKEKVENIAKEKEGQITISSERADVNNGFVLAYGEIEENCQIKALFDADIDQLKDIANQQLFEEETK